MPAVGAQIRRPIWILESRMWTDVQDLDWVLLIRTTVGGPLEWPLAKVMPWQVQARGLGQRHFDGFGGTWAFPGGLLFEPLWSQNWHAASETGSQVKGLEADSDDG